MNILVRSLLVYLLLLALPFQGVAMATMLPCAPAQVAPSMAPHHDHQAMLAMQRAAHAPAATGAIVAAAADGGSCAHAAGKCDACAACCLGAMVCATVHVALDSPRGAAIAFDTGFVAAVALALPERPPQASR
ncbi:hypothetical protein [Massilia sp. DWR3-1-1]|uniref:hypothetical protein n=1 Tax=Massilia sp. DWR3-1-1 TaxID=2804559 RepID=UPI003CEF0130